MSHSTPRRRRACLLLALLGCAALVASCSSSKRYAAEIGPAGGSLVGPGGVTVVVPADAVISNFTLVISGAPGVRRPSGTAGVASAVHLEPDGQSFLKPLSVTFPIAPSALPGGSTLDDVIVLRADHGSDVFVPIPTRRVGSAVVCDTEHFSDFIAVVIDGSNPFGSCGNGMCDPTESCSSCPLECGLCVTATDGGVVLDASVDASGIDAGPPPPRWVDNGDGSVTDTLTTLQWEHTPSATLVTLAAAMTYCTGLTIGGHTDWRVPTLLERVWIVDTTRFSPSIDTTVFDPAAPETSLWTTTPFAIDGTRNWTITTTAGRTSFEFVAMAMAIPWCVRGTALPALPTFVDNADGTVSDANAGLTWQQVPMAALGYSEAVTYCSTLTLGGASGWRVPTIEELFRLGRYDLSSPALDVALFTPSPNTVVWSSTPFVQITNDQWIWSQTYGESVNSSIGSSFPVRCVR